MGIRETVNKNPSIMTGATIGIIVLAIALIVWQLMPEKLPGPPTKAFYSDDDGKTFFVDERFKVVPFKHDGKDAVLAHVYKCETEEPKVGWLERYSKEVKDEMDAFNNDPSNKGKEMPGWREKVDNGGKLAKKPGDKGWTKSDPSSERTSRFQEVKCADGNYAREVWPDEKR